MRWRALSPIGKAAVPWLLEGLLIVISVALGVLDLYRRHLPLVRAAAAR